ncbi:MAG: alpha/beta hydrolase [Chloroflexi bacterium]|nr:alpha/beta hydrolase [Chloroflexota bacterium]MBP8059201.1 alpha/beta hydrolase [Chloroflexota bacterium]
MLELIIRQSEGQAKPTPLLFVHGAWHAAWCWDEHFLPYFAQQGYTCYALSLRGHGNSPGRERLRWTRVAEYVADVAHVVAQLPSPPVIIGHSMGGFVVQKYLEQYTAAGLILLASVPPTGVLPTTLRIARNHPLAFLQVNLRLSLAPLITTPQLTRTHFFSATMPEEQVNAYHARLQDESYLGFLDFLVLNLVKHKRVQRVPTLVLGAQNDTIFLPHEVARTAQTYGTTAKIFADMAHDMMLEPGWPAVAAHMLHWLDETMRGK